MRVREYLETVYGDVTFIKVDCEKDESGHYRSVYRTTPIRRKWEWEASTSGILDMIVVNEDCPPVDETGVWYTKYKQGFLNCCMVESEESIRTRYSEKQAQMMIDYYEVNIK